MVKKGHRRDNQEVKNDQGMNRETMKAEEKQMASGMEESADKEKSTMQRNPTGEEGAAATGEEATGEKKSAATGEEATGEEDTAQGSRNGQYKQESSDEAAAAKDRQEEQGEEDDENDDEEMQTEKLSKEQELEEKVAALQDKYLRLTAEYDNYRKRTLREKMELQEGVREEVFVNILPVVDDLERAMESVSQAKDINAVKTGMELIHTKFTRYLAQQGVKEVEAMGMELNTDQHEAITKIPVDSKKKKGKIVDVVEKGYLLKDKVIRFAKVIIGE